MIDTLAMKIALLDGLSYLMVGAWLIGCALVVARGIAVLRKPRKFRPPPHRK